MEDDIFKKLYQEYLGLVLDIGQSEQVNKRELKAFVLPQRFIVRNINDRTTQIIDSTTGEVTAAFRNKKVFAETDYPGLFTIIDKDEKYGGYSTYCDIYGKKVYPLSFQIPHSGGYIRNITRKSISGKETNYFFNDVLGSYEPLIYEPVVIEYTYEYGHYDDFTAYKVFHVQSKDYILFKDKDNKIYLYRKNVGVYEELPYSKKDEEDLIVDFNYDKNIIRINDTYYYITEFDVFDISDVINSKKWSRNLTIEPVLDDIMSFEEFKNTMKQNKSFLVLLTQKVKELKQKKYQDNLEESKRIQEQEEKLKILKRKKELLQIINDSIKELREIEMSFAGSKISDKLEIEEDILIIDVGDHKEINPLFKDYLSMIDLKYISFKNVKVSGLDFAYSNAIINPQEVYKKDMSNGNYSGLDFNIAHFDGVNICGSIFTDCLMDFSIFDMDKAIKDDSTILPKLIIK